MHVEDLINYGFLPEFVGRFPVLAKLQALSQEQMVHVMTTPRNALLKQYAALFAADGVSLQLTTGAVDAIAAQADKTKTGARGLGLGKDLVLASERVAAEWGYDRMYIKVDRQNFVA